MSEYRLTAEEKRVALERARKLREKLTGPAVPPGGEELREALREELAILIAHERTGKLSAWGIAEAVLALPEMRDALAAQEKLRRGRSQHQPVPAVDVGPGGEYPRDMCSCGESYYDDCDVRRLLDGDS